MNTKQALTHYHAAQADLDAACGQTADIPGEVVEAHSAAYSALCTSRIEDADDAARVLGAVLAEIRDGAEFTGLDRAGINGAMEYLRAA